MRKIAFIIAAAMLMTAAAGCGKEEEGTYADKLVNGEIQPDVEFSDEKDYESETESTEGSGPAVNIAMSDDEMASFIDEAAAEYSSFEFLPIGAPDFFLGKNLRMVAGISEHELNNIYAADIKVVFTNETMTMSYIKDDNTISNEYYVYAVSDETKTTPNGIEYTYVVYGAEPIKSEHTVEIIGVVANVKLSGVDMGEASAESYMFLIETERPEMYELFMEE